jgi:N-acetylmuramoyl-L-alanine amidase
MAGCTSRPASRSRLAASFLFAGVVCSAAATTNKVSAVRFWSLGELTRVAIEVSGEFKYKSERLTNPDRLFFDVEGAKPEAVKALQTIAVSDGIVKQIRIAETQPGVTRVVLDLEQPVEFTASQLTSPDRLMIELHGKGSAKAPVVGKAIQPAPVVPVPAEVKHPIAKDAGPAPMAVAAKPFPKATEPRKFVPPPHMEAAGIDTSAAALAPPLVPPPPLPAMAKPAKLPAVSLSSLKSSLPPAPGAEATEPAAFPDVPKSDVPKPEKSTAGVASEPAKRNANGDRSLTRVLGLKLGRVVIDPGHGGKDVGTHGPSGLYEKEVVLDVSRRLGALIEQRLGSDVVYTRSDDTFIPLEERTHIANDRKADLFLSIHANSSPIRTAAGVEMYYLNFTTSKAAMDVAARENAGADSTIHDLRELLDKIALKDKIDESREFATRLQSSLSTIETKGNTGAKNRGLKKAPFIVLIGANMPSVLAEIGFLTNAGDEALLRKPEYRQKIAEALYKGIASYADTLSHFQVAKRGE